jgi:uncharacterized protein YecT (DUF1311 family)
MRQIQHRCCDNLLRFSCCKTFAINGTAVETHDLQKLRKLMKPSLWRAIAWLAFPALFALAPQSHAAEPDHTADCNQATTQGEMEQCATQALNHADNELNQTYVDYRSQLDQEHQNQIRDIQLAWIKYRDLSCKYATSSSIGGSAHNMALQTCLSAKTIARTQELKALAACSQGDLGCTR